MGKYIIAVCGPQNTGKTTVINNVWDLLPCFDPVKKINLNTRKTHEIIGYTNPFTDSSHPVERNKRIGVNSLGDTVNQVREGLAVLIHHKCDIIVCASRLEIKAPYGDDFEYMLKEAIKAIGSTRLHENHLDLLNETKGKGITPDELPEIEKALKEYEIITAAPFSDFNKPRLSLTEMKKSGLSPIVRMPNTLCSVDLNRFTAQCIMQLIEQLR